MSTDARSVARPVIALAGRRIDAPRAERPGFPLERRTAVRARLEAELRGRCAELLIASAACGADLLGHEAAEILGVRRIVLLPFPRARFREVSVTDRPGNWGELFDRIIEAAADSGDLVELDLPESGEAYRTVTHRILDLARQQAAARGGAPFLALQVWEGRSRGEGDYTAEFGALAPEYGGEIGAIPTFDI